MTWRAGGYGHRDRELFHVLFDLGKRLLPHLHSGVLCSVMSGEDPAATRTTFPLRQQPGKGVIEDHLLPLINKPDQPARRKDLCDDLLPACGNLRRK